MPWYNKVFTFLLLFLSFGNFAEAKKSEDKGGTFSFKKEMTRDELEAMLRAQDLHRKEKKRLLQEKEHLNEIKKDLLKLLKTVDDKRDEKTRVKAETDKVQKTYDEKVKEINKELQKQIEENAKIKGEKAKKKEGESEEKITQLVKIYAKMKPKIVAGILETLDKKLALNILSKLKSAHAGSILSKMKPAVAAEMTLKLSK